MHTLPSRSYNFFLIYVQEFDTITLNYGATSLFCKWPTIFVVKIS